MPKADDIFTSESISEDAKPETTRADKSVINQIGEEVFPEEEIQEAEKTIPDIATAKPNTVYEIKPQSIRESQTDAQLNFNQAITGQ